jgi:hypothetical protein
MRASAEEMDASPMRAVMDRQRMGHVRVGILRRLLKLVRRGGCNLP